MGKRLINFLASGLYISYIPSYIFKRKGKFKGCGFFGTILAFILYPLIPQTRSFLVLYLLIFTSLSIYISNKAYEEDIKERDNPLIVIDEITGYFWSFILVDKNLKNAIVLFIFFRIFDTLKPWPIKKIEEINHRGMAIVMDDIVAGIYASIIVFIFNRL